jgi:hypothetical protein
MFTFPWNSRSRYAGNRDHDGPEYAIAHEGAGIPILICMLAAETVDDGDYPPIDRKVVNGLKRHNAAAADRYDLIAASMAGSANRRRVRTFSEVYVREVIPVWQKLRVRKSAAEADNYLANKGSEKKR